LKTGDVTNAFLTGKTPKRDQPLYMHAPRDPILVQAGALQEAELFEVVGNVYGQANAPNVFSNDVREKMVIIKFQAHSLDVMLFLFYDDQGALQAAILFHVDDMIGTWSPTFDSSPFEEAFDWGDGFDDISMKSLYWNGYELCQMSDGRLKVHQETYCDSISASRVKADEILLTPEEISDYKSCIGTCQYAASKVRLDVAAGTSLAQRGHPTHKELHEANSMLRYLKANKSVGIVFEPIPLDPKLAVYVGYGDSSWANALDCKSQTGSLIILARRECLSGTAPGSIHASQSHRTKRVVRSTLAAEAEAADNTVDRLVYCNAFLSEVITGLPAKHRKPLFEIYCVTDCKSLFDAVRQCNPSLSEKRTIIDEVSIREALHARNLLWVPTDKQLADGLTKCTPELMRRLSALMQETRVTLKHSEG
jgi:hypothetical protein